ncbi:MAG: methionine--tRNA ligase [Candidatus Aenigmarchaeota archaeon]|nr:methionine--tRNA ligase [Candidatus Aenigmarchaeota archaeon]
MLPKKKKFYITTPIYYVNSQPHLGHAYTTIVADMIVRWHRLKGEDVFFLTGTDEHGEKIQKAAEQAGKPTGQFVGEISEKFKAAWKSLNISFDDFIRTTEKRHEKVVMEFTKTVYDKGDIYKGSYEGLYCYGCENFKTTTELVNGRCPDHPTIALEQISEGTYFFRLSKYQKKLLQFFEKNPEFISPVNRREEIINRVKDGLKDLSITRPKDRVKWGIEFPADKGQVIYVWFEALTNYLTAVEWPKGKKFKYWPADVHLVGKEIVWFHSVIWPAMLFSAGIEQPKKIFSHGWWTVNGQKMSKTLGNVVDPVEFSKKYSVDIVRYFLVREIPLGDDGDFSEKALINRINGELVADLGNLVYRVLSLVEKFKGRIEGNPQLDKKLNLGKIDGYMEKLELHNALAEIWEFIRATNKYVNENEPWKLQGKDLGNVLYNLLESCRVISILISPFLPETSEKINKQLGTKTGALNKCKFTKFSGKIKKGEYLFRKVE